MKILNANTYFVLLISSVFFSSCATVFNGPAHTVHFATNIPASHITVDQRERRLHDGEVDIVAIRDKAPLVIGIENADTLHNIYIRSRNTFNYVYDAISTGGLTILLEGDKPQRYYYRRNIYAELKDSMIRVYRFAPVTKGTVHLNLSIPYGNYFYIKTTSGYHHSPGFMGLAAGAEYFYRDRSYLSVQAGAAADFFVPVPAPVKYAGIHEQSATVFVNIRNNHSIGSFDFGYGLSYSSFVWNRYVDTSVVRTTETKISRGLGLSLTSQYRFSKRFWLGLLYQPTLLTMDHGARLDYQHLLSFELTWKLRIRRGR
jgi:hypothetical protein